MSRVRTLAIVTLLGATALLVPASAASAATRATAVIVCDPETGAITTSIAGPLVQAGAPRAVTVEFQRQDAVNISAAALTTIPPLATPFKVTVNTKSNGSISATGYTGSFDPATSLYYQETVFVTLRSSTGILYGTSQATCKRDVRTTVTLTCDEAAGAVTATVLGRDAQPGAAGVRPRRVMYTTAVTYRTSADDPGWTAHTPGWEIDHGVRLAADGTWTDTGYVKPVTASSFYYYAEKLTVGVFNEWGGIVGGGTAECVLVDRSVTAQG
jgi:hypothetical protein